MKIETDSGQLGRLIDMLVDRYHEIESTQPLLSRELSQSERKALKVVAAKEKIAIGVVGKLLGAPPSTTTWIVNSLVEKGIFKRTRDEKDKRKFWIELTDKGDALARLMERIPDRIANDLLYKLDEDRRDDFIKLVGDALENIEKAGSFK